MLVTPSGIDWKCLSFFFRTALLPMLQTPVIAGIEKAKKAQSGDDCAFKNERVLKPSKVCNPISAGGPGTFMKTFVPSINNSLLVLAFDLHIPLRRKL
jgi:hypothetical protein